MTLGDYIIPSVVGAPGYFIGMMMYQQQGTAGNIPLAAAFSVVPIVLPQMASVLLAGGMLAFALSFDEIIVTLFTAGHDKTLPIWFFNELFRPRERPITNVLAVIVIVITLIPILLAYFLIRPAEEHS